MKRLLVVDDEEKIRLVIRKYAEFEGYEQEKMIYVSFGRTGKEIVWIRREVFLRSI